MTSAEFIQRYFFTRVSACGFGAMRIAWGTLAFASLLAEWGSVLWYYSDRGFLPSYLGPLILRPSYRFSMLDWIPNPADTFMFYVILLLSIIFVIVGYRTRFAMIASVLLLFTFQERNPLPLSPGDALLRSVGFLLVLAPGIDALSMDRALRHDRDSSILSATMPVWPVRLILWQLIILNVSSAWEKLLGLTWRSGTAVEIILRHPHFARWPLVYSHFIEMLSPYLCAVIIVWQFSWLLLLCPLPRFVSRMRRILLITNVLAQIGVLIVLEAGTFPLALMMISLGLLTEEDFPFLEKCRIRLLAHAKRFSVRRHEALQPLMETVPVNCVGGARGDQLGRSDTMIVR